MGIVILVFITIAAAIYDGNLRNELNAILSLIFDMTDASRKKKK